MAKGNIPLISFNRGLISPKAIARVDVDRTRLSAEIMTNYLPKTQGAMQFRPGTVYQGSSLNDTGAEFLEFVASQNSVALLELTSGKMRIWQGTDGHNINLLSRPAVETTISLLDTGWSDESIGGDLQGSGAGLPLIPRMTDYTTNGVTMSASSELTSAGGAGGRAWHAADDDIATRWIDTGSGFSGTLPSWLNVDFGSGETRTVNSYSIQAVNYEPGASILSPRSWRLISSAYDTGSYATDTGKWTLEDEQTGETGWGISETRTYTVSGPSTQRHWRLYVTQTNDTLDFDSALQIAEYQLTGTTPGGTSGLVTFNSGVVTLDALPIGSTARTTRLISVDTGDLGTEHALDIHVQRGPVTIRVGSTQHADNYIAEASLGTGYHNLSFFPTTSFYVDLQSSDRAQRIVDSLSISDSGTVELTTPWNSSQGRNIRFDQSADVIFANSEGVRQQQIERRGIGRSWSVVDYDSNLGPFRSTASVSARLNVSDKVGNTTLKSDIAYFQASDVGGLYRIFHNGQNGTWYLGNTDAVTDSIEMTGLNDTGITLAQRERYIRFDLSGVWSGRVAIQRSFDGPDFGWHYIDTGSAFSDTGTATIALLDNDDNIKIWYRAIMQEWTSGAVRIDTTYKNGGKTGVGRITGYSSPTEVDFEVVRRFSDTGSSDNWQAGFWSPRQGYPGSVALHGGRLAHAGGANFFLSVADDYNNFDSTTVGDAGPIIRTLGSGPVDDVYYMISLLRLIAGTAGSEISLRSSSLDEVLTPSNNSARTFSTQGSFNLRGLKMDNRGLFIQRSGQRAFMLGFGETTLDESFESIELTLLVPDLLESGVASWAIQRQPDTRIHCVLNNGTVAILTYEPKEEVVAWSKFTTDGFVEKAMVLPGSHEDAVYYHVRRTINGETKRFLEKWALESESLGDTGLSYLADCSLGYTDTGRTTTIDGFGHLVGESVVVWADDTGQVSAGKDLSPDVDGVQTMYTVDTGGSVTLSESVHHAVAGLPYTAHFRSAKLAYGAEAGTALTQMKRVDKIGFVLYQTHNNGLFFGSDSGNIDPLPRINDEGAAVDPDKIFRAYDEVSMPFPGDYDPDSRVFLESKSPRPATILGAIPGMQTNEKL